MTIKDHMNDLTQKMQHVLQCMQALRQENSALRLANQELTARLHQASAALAQAQADRLYSSQNIPLQEVQDAKGADASNPEQSKKLREEIEHYIAQIDKCIASLRQSETL